LHGLVVSLIFFFFFFQAEDGIRDFHVTGVQTCALPISFTRNFAVLRNRTGTARRYGKRSKNRSISSFVFLSLLTKRPISSPSSKAIKLGMPKTSNCWHKSRN